MAAPDLRRSPPRRWNASVGDVIWLPRFADKARAFDANSLGDYLYGQSPIDDSFLRASRLTYASFLDIVRRAPDDAAVLAEIERASPGATQRLRKWSVKVPLKAWWILGILDIDDGYPAPPLARAVTPVVRAAATVVSRLARVVRPSQPP